MYWNKKTNTIYGHYENINNPIESYEKPVLESIQIKAIKMVIEDMVNNGELEKDKIHRELWKDTEFKDDTVKETRIKKLGLPVVFIAKYTLRDEYGELSMQEVFSNRTDAVAFLKEMKEKYLVTDEQILARPVYFDKDRTVELEKDA